MRVEVSYHAPAGAVVRDVLEIFRTPTWVRFMMRYISPRLKSSSPADQSVLEQLQEGSAAQSEAQECAICLSESPGDGLVALPCAHSFHYPCIEAWLQNQSTCPVCRFQFPKAFTGIYAVDTLESALVLPEALAKLPRAELPALNIEKQSVKVMVSVTLVKVASEERQQEYPCQLSAWLFDAATGDRFSELDCLGS